MTHGQGCHEDPEKPVKLGVTVDALFFGNIFKFSWPPFFIEGLYVGSMN